MASLKELRKELQQTAQKETEPKEEAIGRHLREAIRLEGIVEAILDLDGETTRETRNDADRAYCSFRNRNGHGPSFRNGVYHNMEEKCPVDYEITTRTYDRLTLALTTKVVSHGATYERNTPRCMLAVTDAGDVVLQSRWEISERFDYERRRIRDCHATEEFAPGPWVKQLEQILVRLKEKELIKRMEGEFGIKPTNAKK